MLLLKLVQLKRNAGQTTAGWTWDFGSKSVNIFCHPCVDNIDLNLIRNYKQYLSIQINLLHRPRKSSTADFLPKNTREFWAFWYHSNPFSKLYKLIHSDLRSIRRDKKARNSRNSTYLYMYILMNLEEHFILVSWEQLSITVREEYMFISFA